MPVLSITDVALPTTLFMLILMNHKKIVAYTSFLLHMSFIQASNKAIFQMRIGDINED